MSLTTKEAVRSLGIKKNIGLDTYTDEELEDLIAESTEYMESETGRALLVQEKMDMVFDFLGTTYVTDFSPIVEIKSFKLDNDEIEPGDYYVDLANGIIRFENRFLTGISSYLPERDLEIVYTAGLVNVPKNINRLCTDIVLETIKSNYVEDEGLIIEKTENKRTVKYDRSKDTFNNIDDRLNKLKVIRIKQG